MLIITQTSVLTSMCVCSQSASSQIPLKSCPTVGGPIIGLDFSPCACVLPNSSMARAVPCCEHAGNEASMSDPHPTIRALIMGLLWQTHTLSCIHSQFQPGPHSKTYGLFLCSQTKPSPRVCPLNPEFQHPDTVHICRYVSQPGKCGNMAAISAGPSLSCLAAGQQGHIPLRQTPGPCNSLSVSADLPASKSGSQGEGTIPLL